MKKLIKHMGFYFVIALLGWPLLSSATPKNQYIFKTPHQRQRFDKLTQELRCMVCQNESLAASQATLAADLRQRIANKIMAGQSNQAIIDFLVKRYGDFVLYKPPFQANTWLLWLAPALILLITFIGLFTFLIKSRKITADTPIKGGE